MKAKKEKPDRRYPYQVYSRIKNSKDENGKNLCWPKWRKDSGSFYEWYEKQASEQGELCWYCHLPGCTSVHYGSPFRKGKRGLHLEVDRMNNDKGYSPNNCVLACYPCNNAKSDVFTYDEFVMIGKAIGKAKKRRI